MLSRIGKYFFRFIICRTQRGSEPFTLCKMSNRRRPPFRKDTARMSVFARKGKQKPGGLSPRMPSSSNRSGTNFTTIVPRLRARKLWVKVKKSYVWSCFFAERCRSLHPLSQTFITTIMKPRKLVVVTPQFQNFRRWETEEPIFWNQMAFQEQIRLQTFLLPSDYSFLIMMHLASHSCIKTQEEKGPQKTSLPFSSF